MGICWYCHWGWPKPVADIYESALESLNGYDDPLKFGPGHIVWSDENFDSAEWCLEHFEEYADHQMHTDAELAIAKWSLEELAKLPLEVRDIVPDDYDDEHPENYPPRVEVVSV